MAGKIVNLSFTEKETKLIDDVMRDSGEWSGSEKPNPEYKAAFLIGLPIRRVQRLDAQAAAYEKRQARKAAEAAERGGEAAEAGEAAEKAREAAEKARGKARGK